MGRLFHQFAPALDIVHQNRYRTDIGRWPLRQLNPAQLADSVPLPRSRVPIDYRRRPEPAQEEGKQAIQRKQAGKKLRRVISLGRRN